MLSLVHLHYIYDMTKKNVIHTPITLWLHTLEMSIYNADRLGRKANDCFSSHNSIRQA